MCYDLCFSLSVSFTPVENDGFSTALTIDIKVQFNTLKNKSNIPYFI